MSGDHPNGRVPASLIAGALAVLAALTTVGCGAGSSSTVSGGAPARIARLPEAHSTEGGRGRRPPSVAPLKISGGGSSQFKVEGGDNSIQEYGEEAGGSQLRQAAEAVHAFFVARVRGEWARACDLLAKSERQGLEGLVSGSSGSDGDGCPAALGAIARQISPTSARELTAIDAAGLRREGEQAFLIYTGPPGRTAYAIPLYLEGGAWSLGAISGAELPGT